MDSRERIFRLNMKNTLGRLDEARSGLQNSIP